eukprot:46928-Hanusia_phi.AAC.1
MLGAEAKRWRRPCKREGKRERGRSENKRRLQLNDLWEVLGVEGMERRVISGRRGTATPCLQLSPSLCLLIEISASRAFHVPTSPQRRRDLGRRGSESKGNQSDKEERENSERVTERQRQRKK